LAQQGKINESIAELRDAIQRNPDLTAAHNSLAWKLATANDVKLREPTQAVMHAKKAVELASNDANAWNTLGVAQYRNGQLAEAIAALKKSDMLFADGNVVNWLFLAMAHGRLDEQKEASLWYARAIAWMDDQRSEDDEINRFRAEAARCRCGRRLRRPRVRRQSKSVLLSLPPRRRPMGWAPRHDYARSQNRYFPFAERLRRLPDSCR
jgi:tetratricopeptide (TPR) repeat protein